MEKRTILCTHLSKMSHQQMFTYPLRVATSEHVTDDLVCDNQELSYIACLHI